MTDIVVDTSALISFLSDEPQADAIEKFLIGDAEKHISALNVYECKVVIERRFDTSMQGEFELLIVKTQMHIHPFDLAFVHSAYQAYRAFGRGGGHRAKLNLGDCAAYALANALDAPLLYVGDDFTHTDISSCL